MSKDKNNIKCDVVSCKHNDCKCCSLDEVEISCNCKNDECNCSDETVCKSFCEKNDE